MQQDSKPLILKKDQHGINAEQIPSNAQKVLWHLLNNGFQAYLVGGCVRDLLLKHLPKDFDIATDARPEQVKQIFNNCRLIGRRFRLAHVYFKEGLIEVATFRGHNPQQERSEHGMILRDNVYGSLEEDAYRRDFTLNALYYDIHQNAVLDFTNGFNDLQNRRLTIIGDPYIRYQEDPVRLLRAARFAAKLNMQLETRTREPIDEQAALLEKVSPSRLFDEVIKLFHTGHAQAILHCLFELGIMDVLFPDLANLIEQPRSNNFVFQFLDKACRQTDQRIHNNKGVSCVFLYAVLLWPIFIFQYNQALTSAQDTDKEAVFIDIARRVIRRQSWVTGIPKRFHDQLIAIWRLQFQLVKAKPSSASNLLAKPRFRAGFDLLLLRGEINERLRNWGQWWQRYQQISATKKQRQLFKKIPRAIKQVDF